MRIFQIIRITCPRPARDPPEAFPQATDDMVKSEAEIGVEVYQAMSYAISEA